MVEEFQQYSVQFRRHKHLTERVYRDITSLYTPRRHGRSNHSSPVRYMTVTSLKFRPHYSQMKTIRYPSNRELRASYNIIFLLLHNTIFGAWGRVVVKELRCRSRDRSPVVSLWIFSVATDETMCPGVNSTSKNEYQDTPGGKDGRCVRVTTLPSS